MRVTIKAGTRTVTRYFEEPTDGYVLSEGVTDFGAQILRVRFGEEEDYFFLSELVLDAGP